MSLWAPPPPGRAGVTVPRFFPQENGHVKINGDLSPKAEGEAAPLNGNGAAEPAKEEPGVQTGSGDAIEPAPVAEGGENKPEGGAAAATAPKETPKRKKKRFSFKKSFKLSGISFRKAKKEAGEASGAASPSEEQGAGEAQAEGGAVPAEPQSLPASQAKEEAPAEAAAAAAPAEAAAQEVVAEREEGSGAPGQQQQQQEEEPPRETTQEDTQPEEASKPAEADPSLAPEQSE